METSTQPAAPASQLSTTRKRTSADRKRKDCLSRPQRWAGVSYRSPEGRHLREVREELLRHLGGTPSATQRQLVERAAMLTLHLAKMDTALLAGRVLSDHAHRQYLGFSNALSRCVRQLGLKGAGAQPQSLADLMSEATRKRAA